MSVLIAVLDAVRRGVPSDDVARHLGVDPGLAQLAVEHWVRTGVITPAGELGLACRSCPAPSAAGEPAKTTRGCPGCPFSR